MLQVAVHHDAHVVRRPSHALDDRSAETACTIIRPAVHDPNWERRVSCDPRDLLRRAVVAVVDEQDLSLAPVQGRRDLNDQFGGVAALIARRHDDGRRGLTLHPPMFARVARGGAGRAEHRRFSRDRPGAPVR